LVETRSEPPAANARERELLEALQRRGELTPAQAAMETSLTVNEADKMLEELAAKGHLDVKVRGGGLFYGLWESDSGAGRREIGEE
jgi:predicted ArsR family transcriptional regulator